MVTASFAGQPLPAGAAVNPIVAENQQPGTTTWQLNRAGFTTADDVSQQIKGYASASSVNKGDSIAFSVSVNPAQTFTIDIYRVGWYGGTGGRLMQHIGPLNGVRQPTCPTDATTGMIECRWPAAVSVSIPTTWTSGMYLVLLTNAANYQNYVPFVVRDDSRTAALLYQASVTTWQAYNDYPNDNVSGKSLYGFNSYGANTVSGGTQAVKVSFERPYANDGTGTGDLINYELYFIRWLEQNGYDVSYSTDVDTHTSGARLLAYKGFLSVGHDEYWSQQMYDAVQAARDAGVNVGFFGANEIYWQIRFESSPTTGVANRVIVCYRSASLDPVSGPTTTVLWRDAPVNRPEQSLVGIQFTSQIQGYPQYVVTNSGNWVYATTGFHDGDQIPGITGYEVDRNFSNYPQPASIPGTYTLLSQSPVLTSSGANDYANSSIYQAPSGARVFAAGTIWWSQGLSASAADARIQQTTRNILDTFANAPLAPRGVVATAGNGSVALAWSANTEPNLAGYNVYRSTTLPVPTSGTPLNGATPLSSPKFADTGLMNGVKYYYAVEAVNTLGYRTAGYPVSATPTGSTSPSPPAPPQNVSASAGDRTVTLTWSPNTEADLAGYNVYRGTSASVPLTSPLNGSTLLTTTRYADSGLTNGTTYYYVVEAVTTAGLKGDSTPVSATPQAAAPSAPAAPTGLSASRGGSARNQFANLSWTDNATNETSFVVERSTDGSTFATLATLGANTVSYKDVTVAGGKTYWYRVKAVNSTGTSAPSNVASVMTR